MRQPAEAPDREVALYKTFLTDRLVAKLAQENQLQQHEILVLKHQVQNLRGVDNPGPSEVGQSKQQPEEYIDHVPHIEQHPQLQREVHRHPHEVGHKKTFLNL